MNFMIRADSLGDLTTALRRYDSCRVVSIEQRISVGRAFYELTMAPRSAPPRAVSSPALPLPLALRGEPVPLALRARCCPKGHTTGYKKSGPAYRCIECRRINSRYHAAKRRARRRRERELCLLQKAG
jgi:hypothetical protein